MDYDAILSRKLDALFPDADTRAVVKGILDSYGMSSHERELARTRLAILKVAGADPDRIEKTTALARQDYRDILMMAEYPRQAQASVLPDGPAKTALVEADRAEYLAWLEW